jgi:hypothetical protein
VTLKIYTSKLEKSVRREKKRNKNINGMKISGASVKDIQRIQQERAERIRRKRQREELEGE